MGPPAKRVLDAIDEQGRHADRGGEQQPARDLEPTPPEALAGGGEQHGIENRDRREHRAAELGEGERREQPHGADHDQGTRIPQHVHQIEAGSQIHARPVVQELPERLRAGGVDHAGRDRTLQVLLSEHA
jgi:hypothetical protein